MPGAAVVLRTQEAEREAIIRQAAAVPDRAGEPPERREAFFAQYFRHVALDDLALPAARDLAGLADSHRRLAASRPRGFAAVRVFTPEVAADGWSVGHTVIEIVTDDSPFLVDSVNAELARADRGIHLVIHPQLVVRRDITGRLLEVLDSPEPGEARDGLPPDAVAESWIHVEIDRETGAGELAGLADSLRRVLDDVRVTVEDWPRMEAAARDVIAQLEASPPVGVDEAEVAEARQLMAWLVDGHFTFIGYREYDLREEAEGLRLTTRPGTGLGVLRSDPPLAQGPVRLTRTAAARALDHTLLVLTKANSLSTVHRSAYLDYLGVKTFDAVGNVVGERRFLGLFASSAYTDSVIRVPVLRRKVAEVLHRSGFSPESHSGKDLRQILETFPRDELFEISVDDLYNTVIGVMQLQERRRTRLFMRTDEFGRFVACLVYLPRERYTTLVRRRLEQILVDAFGAANVDYRTRVSESVLARLYFVVRMPAGVDVPEVDAAELERRLAAATRSWDEDLADELRAELGEERAAHLLRQWAGGLPEEYKAGFDARRAVADLRRVDLLDADDPEAQLQSLSDPERLSAAGAGGLGERRFTLYRNRPLSLSAVLPYLANFGLEVVDERPYRLLRADGRAVYVYDFGLRSALPAAAGVPGRPERSALLAPVAGDMFCEAFAAAWRGETESDGFDRLGLAARLNWRQVGVLRAYAKYLRQAGTTFSQEYVEESLTTQPGISALLVQLFETRFGPESVADGGVPGEARQAACDAIEKLIMDGLDDVASLDHDRILRSLLSLVLATVRTNFWRRGRRSLAFKIDPHRVSGLPEPRPAHEIFVYSPRVEGVHLRFGAVARGGLRWSDRREDYRTEVLGLVKAQMVKNAVIVPTGAKGGFLAKRLPDPAADRDAWLAEGREAYVVFVSGLLDLTDNLDERQRVVPPEQVVRWDADDTYLVVAADKGTATFSDLANEVAKGYGFWLGDAFASGGSHGYDHKAMGITARGAWESVRRHFRELGRDVQTEPTTVVGIGDMSGDVFGNGMLLSQSLELVAAFDHRHLFLDPDPDPAVSFAERQRLFRLPRSSWADYDPARISEGGGVHPRTAKSVPVSEPVRRRLGLPQGVESLTPVELMRAILTAPVDLLWNGGIGTYVKASTETHADVGDRANDAIRVNGDQLRARVIGEGGNLGLTQLGRVQAALGGVRVNTDAIDNSAGVDCSDHEVNIKILLDGIVRSGNLDPGRRNELLVAMTDDVSSLVLRDNYEQNVLLGNARRQSRNMLGVHRRFIRALEKRGALNRALEYIPDEPALARRAEAGLGLTSPEFSVLVAHAKLTLTESIVNSPLPDEPYLEGTLRSYFPEQLVARYADRLSGHPLRRQIITTCLVNDMVNRGGITFAYRAADETAASEEQVARAYIVCRQIFDLHGYVTAIEALDNVLPTATQTTLYLEFRRLLDRSVRWFLQSRPGRIAITAELDRFGPVVAQLGPLLPELVVGAQARTLRADTEHLLGLGVPEPLAVWGASLLLRFTLLDITELAAATSADPVEVARLYLAVSERFRVEPLLDRITRLGRGDRWQTLARAALRYDLYAAAEALTAAVLAATPEGPPEERIDAWARTNPSGLARTSATLDEILRLDQADLASLSVALRTLRGIVRVTG